MTPKKKSSTNAKAKAIKKKDAPKKPVAKKKSTPKKAAAKTTASRKKATKSRATASKRAVRNWTIATAYPIVKRVADPTASEGLKKERAILLLWFLRNVMGIDDLEAYEHVCDGDNDQGIDGVYLEQGAPDSDRDTLVLFQSKYPASPKNVGRNDLKGFVGSAAQFETSESLEAMIDEGLEPELGNLLKRYDVKGRLERGTLDVRLVFVTAGALDDGARRYERGQNTAKRRRFLHCYDALDLAPIIEAFASPETVSATVKLTCPANLYFEAPLQGSRRVVVAAVRADEIAALPGVLDRTLFDLNVRRELKNNRVRRALDGAIRRQSDHENFLAFHNGLTVVCESVTHRSNVLTVRGFSVVNGAQSTVAFYDNVDEITDKLRVVAKFVETAPETQLAREVAIRSNTQNPVTNRNLRARDGIQLRLLKEFENQFPDITFEIRPDASNPATGHVIHNDGAAQLLCAVFNQRPWIAIKKLALFDADWYPQVYHSKISAAHVVLADKIFQAVQDVKDKCPRDYLRSWQLTRLVAVYLVGQMLRTDVAQPEWLDEPSRALKSSELRETLFMMAKLSAATLKIRNDSKKRSGELDDFKVDFKRESALRELGATAREKYVTWMVMDND